MEINTGNTAWLLLSSALVLLMTPGLALFYGGLNRSKGVLNMMMMSFSAIGLISVLWVIYGFTLAFGTNDSAGANNVIGSFTQYFGTQTNFIGEEWLFLGAGTGIPTYVFMVFQMMFAVITVALISGAVSDRLKFSGWLLFAFAWFTLVYVPVAHWVWGGGFIGSKIKALDFAGGTAVHINAGAAALGLVLVLGKRVGWPRESFKPHNIPFVALGAGLLWFGWFGFNAGSELTVDGTTAVAFVNTQVATAAGVLGWVLVEWVRSKKPTLVGASSGAIAGLVAITPACGFIAPLPSVLLGLIAGAVCAVAVSLKYRFGFDDSLDVVGVHFVAGWIGSLFIGLFATLQVNSAIEGLGASEGLFYGGGVTQLGRQALASGIVSVYSFGVAVLIALAVKALIGLRTGTEDEVAGIDVAEHAESAYDLSPTTGSSAGGAFAMAGIGAAKPAPESAEPADEPAAPVSEKVAG
ncbi:ammonium transporter [Micromonospora sp. 4G57]|uniref:Ammonium transporter n=1 Tax=Micromonospora sicca TaxID=2202420 RepID=A0ABU5JE28_9ACTN|nr:MULTISPECIES: ammonium transporter [unclassified Micromonospora]MDZ5442524.1 ammonium transporter [Micromonospora sp. 4G57]MDZ5490724.1 ammonium transporter [Micromonospora sp. 4G53]